MQFMFLSIVNGNTFFFNLLSAHLILLRSVCPEALSRSGHTDIVRVVPPRVWEDDFRPSQDTDQLVVEELGASGSGLIVAGLLRGTAARDEDEAEPEAFGRVTTSRALPSRVLLDLGGRPRRLGIVPRATMQSAVGVAGWALGRSHRRSPC